MKIKRKDLMALLETTYGKGYFAGEKNEENGELIRVLRGELNGAREEIRIHKHTANTAESKANALETQLEKERATVEKLDNTLANFAKHNKMLRDKLEAAGIDAPTYGEFLIMESSKKTAEEVSRELMDEEEGEE